MEVIPPSCVLRFSPLRSKAVFSAEELCSLFSSPCHCPPIPPRIPHPTLHHTPYFPSEILRRNHVNTCPLPIPTTRMILQSLRPFNSATCWIGWSYKSCNCASKPSTTRNPNVCGGLSSVRPWREHRRTAWKLSMMSTKSNHPATKIRSKH